MMMLEQKLHAVLYGNECPICKSSAVKDKLADQEAELVRLRKENALWNLRWEEIKDCCIEDCAAMVINDIAAGKLE